MRHRSKLWTSLAARGRFTVESSVVINGVIYEKITAPKIDRALMTNPLSVGNCITASLRVSVLTDNAIPASAEIVARARITDGSRYSEWMDFGTFWVDQRSENEGLHTFTAYDAMKKTDQSYIADGDITTTGWPKTMKACVEEIATRIGVAIDPRTRIKTGDDYIVSRPEQGMTMKQVLGYIGGVHGGNWIITEENLLRLVPLISAPEETYNIIDEDYNAIVTGSGDRLVYKSGGGERSETQPTASGSQPTAALTPTWRITDQAHNPIVTQDGYYLIWGNSSYNAVGGLINVPIVIGAINTGKNFTISKVSMTTQTGESMSYGNDSGAKIAINGNPYATDGICQTLYNELNGLEYRPFTATQARYDPAAELGDWIKIGDSVRSVLYVSQISLGVDFLADVSAPTSDEITSEFPYPDRIDALQRSVSVVKKDNVRITSRIEVLDEEVFIEVTDDVTGETHRASRLETTISGIKLTTVSKNGSAFLHLDNGENSSDVALTLSASDPSDANRTSTLTLKAGSATLSSAKIDFSGLVTFSDLEDSGKTTSIRGDYISTGTIDAEMVNFSSDAHSRGGGFKCAQGCAGEKSDGSEIITYGAMMYGWQSNIKTVLANGDNPDYYFIATNAGVRMQSPSASFYVSGGTIKASTSITEGSDRRIKNSISYDLVAYERFFLSLKPALYKFNKGTSDRLHTGYIAQDVQAALLAAGLSTQEFAAFVIEPEEQGGQYGLRYSEFVPLNTYMIQRAFEEIEDIKAQIRALGGMV